MTRIVCVGITVLDRIWYLDDLPKEGGEICRKRLYGSGRRPGGNGGSGSRETGAEVDSPYWSGGRRRYRQTAARGAGIPRGEHPLYAHS